MVFCSKEEKQTLDLLLAHLVGLPHIVHLYQRRHACKLICTLSLVALISGFHHAELLDDELDEAADPVCSGPVPCRCG